MTSLVYSNLRSAHGDAAMHALAREIMPRLIQLESDINLDDALFKRVQTLHERRAGLGLDVEQATLLDKTYRAFRRNGGLLEAEAKARLRAIDAELSTLGPQFSENVLKSTNGFEMWLDAPAQLAGLPESAREAAAQAAAERGRPGAWLVTLAAPSLTPFLRYADDRELRRKLWLAHNSRAFQSEGAGGNQALVRKIARLRHQRAKLLGYESHAHFQMEERMAESPDKVRAFLERLLQKSRPAAEREMSELREMMRQRTGEGELMPWDYAYWANKLREERYELDAEALRPYFRLENVLDGAFEHARRLYDLEFKATTAVPAYAPDVTIYEVRSTTDGRFMGLLYADFFPRPTKGGGGWCTRYRAQWSDEAGMHRPHVSIVCNFTKPTATKPALLTFMEVSTLFHEFGHALHSLLSACRHRSLSCTNVYRDFVELPSQIMENWIKERESLRLFARHYETGELIPDELVSKLVRAENFHAAYQMMRQLRFALLDLAWYAGDPGESVDVAAFEAAAVRPTDLLPNIAGTNLSCSFEHIFAGGYSAGYYGYKWAEVLDADAFELFKEEGIFSREVADRFRSAILERGGAEHPMTLYKRFRGREPDPDALLRRSQLI
jgi:peptidyl-dipeptidase Dcp